VVVLNSNGDQEPLATQTAADVIADTDPMWCPAGTLPGGSGCTNFATVQLLQNDINGHASNYAHDGIIYFTSSATSSFTLTSASLGSGDFNAIKPFDLTLQGGWDGTNGAISYPGQTDFANNSISIGTSGNRWVGNITLSNFTFNNSGSIPVSIFTTTGNIALDNVDVNNQTNNLNTTTLQSNSGNITVQNGSSFDGDNSGTNQSKGFSATTGGSGTINISNTTFQDSLRTGNTNANGATLSASTITLTNVTSNNNDGNGIAASNYNVLTLNNVTANGNGTGDATLAGNTGSGIRATGLAGSRLIVIGGSFNNNKRYGIQDTTSTIYVQSNPTCTGNVGGCYNVATIFDNTPPAITPNITGTLGTNGWYKSDVKVSWTVTDPQSGIMTSAGCTPTDLTSDTGGTLLACSATNNAGLSNSASVTIKIDKTAPVINFTTRTPANGNGWNNNNVTVNWTCTDSESGVVSPSLSSTLSSEGVGQSATGTCTDNASNTSSDMQTGINIDKTNPILNLPAALVAEATGPTGAVVNLPATVSDNLDSGISLICIPASGSLFSFANTAVNCSATDLSENSAVGSFLVTVQDTTPPVIVAHGDVFNATTQTTGSNVIFTNPITTDAVDGTGSANCSPTSGSHFPVGNTLVTCNAIDSHGNASTPITFLVHLDYGKRSAQTSGSGNTVIPVTGGQETTISCDSQSVTIQIGEIKVTLTHFCGYEVVLQEVSRDNLPGTLGQGNNLEDGVLIKILKDGKVIDTLPLDASISVAYPKPGSSNASVLTWNGNGWQEQVSHIDGNDIVTDLAAPSTLVLVTH
jgi:hypothetical protein